MFQAHRRSFTTRESTAPFNREISIVSPGTIPARWLAICTALSLVAVVGLMAWAQLKIDPFAASTLIFVACGLLAAGARYRLRSPRNRTERIARDISEYFGLFTLISLMGATATYPLSAGSHGFVDQGLQQMDAALRFNWLAWYNLVAAHRSLQLLGTIAYQSIFVTPAILLGYFAWTHRRAEAHAFLAAFWLAAVISLALFRFIPAEGPLAFMWRGPIPYMPESALYQAQLIPELRDHALYYVDLGALRGLVSAPSFHTASAILFIAAAWPFRRLRYGITFVNVAMLLSTPVEGTHYLTDMIAGALVALIALTAVAEIGHRLRTRDREHNSNELPGQRASRSAPGRTLR